MGMITISNINSQNLEEMLVARDRGDLDFILVDVREWLEWGVSYISGTDYLLPYSNFLFEVRKIKNSKNSPIVVYCSTGKRSLRCINSLKQIGFTELYNLKGGIEKYNGTILYP